MLSLTVDAVDIEYVDTYATDRGRMAWLDPEGVAEDEQKAAIRRATDYLAGTYNAVWKVRFEPDDPPVAVKMAIAEAATREIEEPDSLAPDLDRGGAIQSFTAGSVSIVYADGASPVTVFQSIENLLLAEGMIAAKSNTRIKFTKRA